TARRRCAGSVTTTDAEPASALAREQEVDKLPIGVRVARRSGDAVPGVDSGEAGAGGGAGGRGGGGRGGGGGAGGGGGGGGGRGQGGGGGARRDGYQRRRGGAGGNAREPGVVGFDVADALARRAVAARDRSNRHRAGSDVVGRDRKRRLAAVVQGEVD